MSDYDILFILFIITNISYFFIVEYLIWKNK